MTIPELTINERIGCLKACSFTDVQIAQALDMTVLELRTKYADDLEHGAERARAAIIEAMYRAACAGNKGAADVYYEQTGRRVHGPQ